MALSDRLVETDRDRQTRAPETGEQALRNPVQCANAELDHQAFREILQQQDSAPKRTELEPAIRMQHIDRVERYEAPTLGPSVFNYAEYSPARFVHYYQQIASVLRLSPRSVLEVGPGDHTVTDFLRRKGIKVETLDGDPNLHPTYLGDLRGDFSIPRRYDVVLASEVLEHMSFRWFSPVLDRLARLLEPGGHLLLSLPYSTLRFFAPNGDVISCEGRIPTGIPLYQYHRATFLPRALRRIVAGRSWRDALPVHAIPEYPDERVDVHHWDLGIQPTTRRRVRRVLGQRFRVVEETAHVDTNCVFYCLAPTTADPSLP
jgi:hypothetical protein